MEAIRRHSSFLIYLFINLIFIAKYSSRVTEYYFLLLLLYSATVGCLFYGAHRLPNKFFSAKVFYGLAVLFIASSAAILMAIPPESLRVDRYEMINNFWNNFFAGINPYTPPSTVSNIPGPFPFYFYLAVPFYAIGEIGYYSLSGFVLFVLILRKSVQNERTQIFLLLLLILSPAHWWEIVCRSTIFVNAALVLAFILVASRVDSNKNDNVLISALVFGLILSTRSVFSVIMFPLLLFLKAHQTGFVKICLWGVGIGVGFAATFLPIMFFPGFFSNNNPFAVQSVFLPNWVPITIVSITALFSLKTTQVSEFVFCSMLAIFALVVAYFAVQVGENSLRAALFASRADISYIILSLPFAILSMADSRQFINRYVGE
jgi:hypothetical protein